MHKHSRALVNNLYLTAHHIVMHPFISAAAEQTVERWEASLQGWQKVLIHERASKRHNYRCLHIYKEIPEDIPSQTFQKSLLSFLFPSRSRLECRIKNKWQHKHTRANARTHAHTQKQPIKQPMNQDKQILKEKVSKTVNNKHQSASVWIKYIVF